MAKRSSASSSNTKTNSKRRVLRELPLALLSDVWRWTIFIVDIVLIGTLALLGLVLVMPGLQAWMFSP